MLAIGEPAALSIAMAAVFALVIGGWIMLRRGERRQGVLMLVAAGVLFANVRIWAWP